MNHGLLLFIGNDDGVAIKTALEGADVTVGELSPLDKADPPALIVGLKEPLDVR